MFYRLDLRNTLLIAIHGMAFVLTVLLVSKWKRLQIMAMDAISSTIKGVT